MSPFLVFLNAARNLASMGMKREQVLDFAKNEFGELTDLMKSQIDNIYRPKKSVSPKDPSFDDTVVKMQFDEEGIPFNPKNPLKDYSKKDKKADGGRIGLRIGSGEGKDVSGREYDAPSAAARSVSTSPSRDRDDGPSNNLRDTRTKKKVIEEVKEGAGKATRSFITNKLFDKFGKAIGVTPFGKKGAALLGIINAIRGSTKKSLPGDLSMLDEEGIGSLPESNLFADVSAKDLKRKSMIEGAGFDYGDAQMMNMINPTMTQEEFEGMMKGTITEPTGKFAAAGGGRVGLKEGMDRRKFLKIMGGLASIPVVGKFFKFAKPAAPAAQKVVETVSQAPNYFFDLVTKIKAFGKQSKVGPSDRVDEYTYIGKNGDEYTLTEDIVTGDAQIVKDKMGVGSSGDKTFDVINDRSVMEYKAPKKDVDPDTRQILEEGAEYDEYRVEFDMDGTQAGADAIDETIQKEIIEEAKKSAPPIKKAAGGLAYMLGE